MYLAPEGDEIAIADAAAGFLANVMPIERLHTPGSANLNPDLRRRLGENGWFALAVPEHAGGSGLSAVEHALFFREAGRQCAPVDLLSQCLATNSVADPELRQAIVSGETGIGLIVADGDQHRVFGSADAAFGLLLTPGSARFHALSGVPMQERPALDPANSICTVANLPEPVHSVPGNESWRLAQLGAAAMLVGIAEAALDLIVEYAKVRETFGRKIGSWQAVRHPCADMAVRAEAARSQLWYAAAALKEGRSDADVHLDAAKHLANVAGRTNADVSMQLHGGIGVTDEHDAHLLLKHALLLERLFGSKRSLLSRLLNAHLED